MIDKRGGFVRFFDPMSLKELSNLTIGGPPHELAISTDHKTPYIPIYGDDRRHRRLSVRGAARFAG